MQKFKSKVAVALASIASFMLAFAAPAAAATKVVVTGNGQAGWLFNRDTSTSTPYQFTTDEHSVGTGSLYVLPIANEDVNGNTDRLDKFVAEQFIEAPVSELNSISYDFKIGSGGDVDDDRQFYLNVYANIDDSDNFYDCRFDYVPTEGSLTNFTTATFNATDTPTTVTKRGTRINTCPPTLDQMPSGSHVRVFSINVGDTSVTLDDDGLDGYLDNIIVSTVEGETVYDFESAVSSKEDCKNGGWEAGLANGSQFKNQGDCVSYFASKNRNQPALVNQAQLRF